MNSESRKANALVAGILVVGTIGLAVWLRPATARFETAASFETGGFAFDYQADWAVHDQIPASTGFGQLLAVMGTLPWGPCAQSDINCHYEQRLGPGQIELQVSRVNLLSDDGICGYARERPDLAGRGPDDRQVLETRYFRIDGRPVVYTRYAAAADDYYLADGVRDWMIAPWDTTNDVFTLQAMFRGPGNDEMNATLDQLIASIQLESGFGPDYPPATDCGDPFPAA
jgi:hypothetical protein